MLRLWVFLLIGSISRFGLRNNVSERQLPCQPSVALVQFKENFWVARANLVAPTQPADNFGDTDRDTNSLSNALTQVNTILLATPATN